MNILTLSYYGTFSRYFSYLKSNICEISEQTRFFNLSIYPSAHLYWKEIKEHSVFLPHAIKKIKFDINTIEKTYKGINIETIMKYHIQLLKIKSNTKEYNALKRNAIKYIEYFNALFEKEKFDAFICSGDSRMIVEIAVKVANKYGVKIFYFEQGPYNTTIIDEQGVNANSSFRKRDLINKSNIDAVNSFIKRKKSTKFFKNNYKYYLLKILDLVYLSPPLIRCFPLELIAEKSFFNLLKRNIERVFAKKSLTGIINYPEKAILLILQVPYDVQMIYHSPLFNNFYDMVKEVHKSLPDGYKLIVREHPLFINNYNKEMYSYISTNKDILIINNMPLEDMIQKSTVVIVNNSTVGLEAIARYKPLVILGDCYYDSHMVGYKVNSASQIKMKIEEAINNPIQKNQVDIFLYNLIFEYLFEGHFQDDNLISGEKVAAFILSRSLLQNSKIL